MDEKDLRQDDFLHKMIGKSSPEIPSAGFTERIMERIEAETAASSVRKPWYGYLGHFLGISGLVSLVILFFLTSDIAVSSWLPGKSFFIENILPSLKYFAESMSFLTGDGKGISIPAMIIAASVLFFVIDLVFDRSRTAGSRQ